MNLFVSRSTRGGKSQVRKLAYTTRSETTIGTTSPNSAEPTDTESAARRVLGVGADASWDDITMARDRLVADLTPGPGATHRNVALATGLLKEVEHAFRSLQGRAATG